MDATSCQWPIVVRIVQHVRDWITQAPDAFEHRSYGWSLELLGSLFQEEGGEISPGPRLSQAGIASKHGRHDPEMGSVTVEICEMFFMRFWSHSSDFHTGFALRVQTFHLSDCSNWLAEEWNPEKPTPPFCCHTQNYWID
jgi:hypothetical protein